MIPGFGGVFIRYSFLFVVLFCFFSFFFFAKLIKSFIFVGLFTRKTKSSNCNIKICVLLQQQQWSISRSRHEKLAALAPIVFLLGSSPPILPKTVFFLSEHYQTVLANVRVSCVCACILLRIFMISKSAVWSLKRIQPQNSLIFFITRSTDYKKKEKTVSVVSHVHESMNCTNVSIFWFILTLFMVYWTNCQQSKKKKNSNWNTTREGTKSKIFLVYFLLYSFLLFQ